MKFSLRKIFYILTLFIFLGCSQKLMIIDPYWEAILQKRGIKMKYLAWRYRFSYWLLPHSDLEQMMTFANQIVSDMSKKGDIHKIILSPLLKEYALELAIKGHNVGVFTTQGVHFFKDNNFDDKKSIHHINLNRHMIIKKLTQEICSKNKSLLVVYTNEGDFKIFTDIFRQEHKDLVSVKIEQNMGIEMIADKVELTLGLSKVDNLFLLAEPYNSRIWKRIEKHASLFENIYIGGGLLIKNERVRMFIDNIKRQMQVLLSEKDEEVFVELLAWNGKSKKFRRENLQDIYHSRNLI